MNIKDHACQDCSWCHNFGTHGYCENAEARSQKDLKNKLTFEELVNNNECAHFADDIWFK